MVFGVATTIMLSIPVVAVAGVISLVSCVAIMNYFANSFKDEDENLVNEFENYEKIVEELAVEEAKITINCYNSLLKIKNLFKEIQNGCADKFSFSKETSLLKDFSMIDRRLSLFDLDNLINKSLDNYSARITSVALSKDIRKARHNSIYTKIFHSKHWGPVLSFMGATGTIFGITNSVLVVSGVTALAGSAILLPAVVAIVAISVSFMFAVKHWLFNSKAEQQEKDRNNLRKIELDGLKTRHDKLNLFAENLQATCSKMETVISTSQLKSYMPAASNVFNQRMESAGNNTAKALNLVEKNTDSVKRLSFFAQTASNDYLDELPLSKSFSRLSKSS
jgi:hypothetical protein